MFLLIVIGSGLGGALLAPLLYRLRPSAAGRLLALLPAGFFLYFVALVRSLEAGKALTASFAWVPGLDFHLSFYVDGLSLLLALIISGIGTLVTIYAESYLAGDPLRGRFYAYLLLFMTSMLGVVLSGNVLALFVFWELTSLSSYLLIGFYHHQEDSRGAALQALLVTGAGGMALLAGLLLLGQVGGSYELRTLLLRGEEVRSGPLYPLLLGLVLVGAFTKSAQFPFHFWLPGAMVAPAPVSAYLHAATMVKAGVYLLARLSPVLGGTGEWQFLLPLGGVLTMGMGAFLALLQEDLKLLLAYSTVSVLGILVLLIGLDTTLSMQAAMVLLVVHALYKGALFLAAGAIDHATGTREISRLGGLVRFMPITTAALALAAFSMAGFPPLLGFISKELLYEAKLQAGSAAPFVTTAGVLANVFLVAGAGVLSVPFLFGRGLSVPRPPHEVPVGLWLGPALLAGLGLVIGLWPGLIDRTLVAPAVEAIRAQPTEVRLALWHGLNPVLLLSSGTILAGAGVFLLRHRVQQGGRWMAGLGRWGPARWYAVGLSGLDGLARVQTRWLQGGPLRQHVGIVLITTLGLVGWTFSGQLGGIHLPGWPPQVRTYEGMVVLMILGGIVATARASSRLTAVVALGVVGYGVALLYILFGAPDLAMTQFAIETLTVILFVLVFPRLPRFTLRSRPWQRGRDLVLALLAGAMMTGLVLAVVVRPFQSRLSPFFAENSVPLAQGRNIVNVILVDFRGIDTLGEITVLAVAALGVYALLKLCLDREVGGEESQ